MTPAEDLTLARARAVKARGAALPPEGLPPTYILDSWARCMHAGLRPERAHPVPVVEAHDLARRHERSALVRRLAQAELETLSRQIAGSNFLLAFADHEGVILDLYADNRFSMSSADAGILAGSCWREGLAGTNGLGTALATGRAVAVTGLEHYFLKLGDISCTAAPVRDAGGQVVGVLDASSYYESRQRHTQALVQMAATHIENGLLTHQMRGHLVLACHPRTEFLGTLSAGLLAFDGDGALVAINGPARHLLSGLDASRGTRFDALFGEPMERVLARLQSDSDVRLRDVLGSALVARMVGRPGAWAGTRPSVMLADPSAALAASGAVSMPSRTGAPSPQISRQAAASKRVRSADAPGPVADFLADDPAVVDACRLVHRATQLCVPLLLQGETGTGKELLARYAHAVSGRRGEFVAVNCAAMPPELFEAELFGYASGAYTGGRREGNAGLIVAADGGTLLLDEVCDLPLQLQAALLRFLDDQTVRPVGGHQARRVDVQLLAATHADLEAEVAAHHFRADLLFRLNTVRVTLPPLRSRRDLPEAVLWALRRIDPNVVIDADALARLARHAWPGNFRELRAVLTRALLQRNAALAGRSLSAADIDAVLPERPTPELPSPSVLQRSAGELVRTAFEHHGRSVSRTARALNISRTTVYRHLGGR